jgi:hypothetical protein
MLSRAAAETDGRGRPVNINPTKKWLAEPGNSQRLSTKAV